MVQPQTQTETCEDLMSQVINFLGLPKPKTKPLGNAIHVLKKVTMPFTTEEMNAVQSFKDFDRTAFISVGGWTVELENCLNKIRSGEIKEFPTALMRNQGKSKMQEKFIAFFNSLDVFNM